jgi:RES domain
LVSTGNINKSGNDLPGEHHLPPPQLEFNQLALPIHHIPLNEQLFRIHAAAYNAIYFGRSGQSRFDAPAKEFGGLYVALTPYGAFRETVLRLTTIKTVDRQDLQSRALSIVTVNRALRLADLTGAGLALIGADGRLTTGSYRVSQQWALALWQHPEQVDGILYRSRLDPSQYCILLFENRFSAIEINEQIITKSLFDYEELPAVLEHYQYGLEE